MNKIAFSIKPVVTVFTATYNGAHTIHRVYESLQVQSYHDFEWLIVDDESRDHTWELIESWQAESNFPIRYFYQSHGHKKIAHNRGVKEAAGELFFILDADDKIFPNTLEILYNHWLKIPNHSRKEFFGVWGLCVDSNQKVIGDLYPHDNFVSQWEELVYKYRIKGEKIGLMRTDVLRDYPFPEEVDGLVPEGIIWCRISPPYKMLFINKKVRIYCANESSITSIHQKDPSRDAQGHMMWVCMVLNNSKYFLYHPSLFLKSAAKYTRYGLHLWRRDHPVDMAISNLWAKCLIAVTLPIGLVAYGHDIVVRLLHRR